ncbi:MAG: 7TM diverse intracellular signaling domain-containing protein [Saprospiraceae bacterium]
MKKLLFLLVLCVHSWVLAQEAVSESSFSYHIQHNADTITLPALQWVLEEGEIPLSYEQLLKGETADARRIVFDNDPRFIIKPNIGYWFNIRLSTSDQPAMFALTYLIKGNCWPFEPTYSDVDSYSRNRSGLIKTGYSGSMVSGTARDYPNILVPSMTRVQLMENDTTDIWCKVIMPEGCKMQVGLALVKEELVLRLPPTTSYTIAQNMLRGAGIAFFFIAVLLFWWYKQKVYLWFMVFQIAAFISSVFRDFQNGLFEMFFHNHPRLVFGLHAIFGTLMIVTLLYFGRVYVNTKEKFPRIHLLLGTGMASLLILTIIGNGMRFFSILPTQLWLSIRPFFLFAFFVPVIVGLSSMIISKDKLAKFYGIGALSPFLGLLFGVVQIYFLGIRPTDVVNIIISGGIMLTMTLALAITSGWKRLLKKLP